MKNRLSILLFLLLFCFVVSAQDLNLFKFAGSFSTLNEEDDEEDDEGDEEDEDEGEEEEEEASSEKTEEESEKDPFANPEQPKDEFVQEATKQDLFQTSEEDDFVVEKREKGVTHRYKEPDLGTIISPTYLYTEADLKSKKLFELYKNDDVVIIEESNNFYKVEFLGKEGWAPSKDVRLEKWYSYRISLELLGGAGSGGGDVKNFSVVGNYAFRFNVAILQDLVIGAEGRGISLDSDVLYAGGGLMLRYYIHGLRTKKTRSAIALSSGYASGVEKLKNNSLAIFGGPYVNLSVDYFFRVWEYIALGLGGDFTYLKMFGKTKNFDLNKEFFQGGAHVSLMFNIMR